MAADDQVVLDTIEGTRLERYGQSGRRVRTGHVRGIGGEGAMEEAEQLIYAKVGQLGTPSPFGDNYRSARLFVYPYRGVADKARFELHYESPDFPTKSSFIIRDASSMQSFQTRFLPGPARHKRLVPNPTWVPDAGSGGADGRVVQHNSMLMTFLRPVRQITVSAVIYGSPPEGIADAMGYVNDAPWNGKDTGYWLVTGIESDVSKYEGYYAYTASVGTKGNEDWSEVGVMVDPLTGLPVQIDEGELAGVLGRPYAYDVMPGNGFARIGPYPTADFAALLGFSSDPRRTDLNVDGLPGAGALN